MRDALRVGTYDSSAVELSMCMECVSGWWLRVGIGISNASEHAHAPPATLLTHADRGIFAGNVERYNPVTCHAAAADTHRHVPVGNGR